MPGASYDVALKRVEHTSRALRVGPWWSARLVKGAARVWVCLRLGAALSGSAQRRTAVGGAPHTPASGFGWCALAPSARALLRLDSGRLRLASAGWGGWRGAHGVICEAVWTRCHLG